MLWPVAALAGLLLSFVLVYGSIVQSRLNAGKAARTGASGHDTGQ